MPQMSLQHAHECAQFLKSLRQTGNAVMAAEAVGVPYQRFHHRRRRFPDFAQDWAAAVAFAESRLAKQGATDLPKGGGTKTQGGEYVVVSTPNRRLQVRRAAAGRITAAGERKFLATLAATANVRLACDTIGMGHSAIYKRRKESNAFALEMDRALQQGYDRLELATLASAAQALSPDGTAVGDWDAEVPEGTAPGTMSADQALNLLNLHRKTVRENRTRLAHNARPATREETDAAILRKLAQLKRQEERDAKRKG